jgi:hypothetical protein
MFPSRPAQRVRAYRPRFEVLEARHLLSTYVVDRLSRILVRGWTMTNRSLLTYCFIGTGWMILGASQAWIYFQPKPQQVFVKTFDCPEGKMVDVVPTDDTPVVQWWWCQPDRHLVYHQDGKLTYVDTATLRQIIHDH